MKFSLSTVHTGVIITHSVSFHLHNMTMMVVFASLVLCYSQTQPESTQRLLFFAGSPLTIGVLGSPEQNNLQFPAQ